MTAYQTFSIKETNHFIPSRYPQLQVDLKDIVAELAAEPESKSNMLLSFVKNRCIDSELVSQHPQLARLISTGTLPLQLIEVLFDAGKKSPPFKKELEEHIRNYFVTTNSGTHY